MKIFAFWFQICYSFILVCPHLAAQQQTSLTARFSVKNSSYDLFNYFHRWRQITHLTYIYNFWYVFHTSRSLNTNNVDISIFGDNHNDFFFCVLYWENYFSISAIAIKPAAAVTVVKIEVPIRQTTRRFENWWS